MNSLALGIKKSFPIDARDYQILFLSCFLTVGISSLGWETDLVKYCVLIGSCLAFQYLAILTYNLKINSLKSALITSLGLSILVQANHWYLYILIAFIAIGAKFLFRFRKKHFINPANFGIIAAILLTDQVWISPGQWGNFAILFFIIGCLGFIVTYKVNRIDLSAVFLLTFFLLEFFYHIIYLQWPLDHLLQSFTNGGFLLFTFFMITDPVSTPAHHKARKFWTLGIAILAFILKEFYYVPSAPFWALFYFAFTTPFLTYYFPTKDFLWKNTPDSYQNHIINNEKLKLITRQIIQ
jgi:Na+-transporting NADH:ubiquinone oxidoreductase subunit NqrB